MARKCIFLLLILFTLMSGEAFAENNVYSGHLTEINEDAFAGIFVTTEIVIPDGVLQIGEEAFAGNTSITEVVIPDGVLEIGDRAFSYCSNLGWLSIPSSVENLGEDFVDGSAEDLLIRTVPASAACQYAQYNLVDYQADTIYRALLIGQTYPDIPALKLNGPENDVAAMDQCLSGFDDTPYQTRVCTNLTADEMLDAIADTFESATAEDVSLFYYSGHGVFSDDASQQGALLGADNQGSITASCLRSALDGVPGRKIVIIDACYSGNMISDHMQSDALLSDIVLPQRKNLSTDADPVVTVSADNNQTVQSFADSFISAFSEKKRRSLVGDSYFVLTSAAEDEECFEDRNGDRIMGLFTSSLVTGCGYDVANDCSISLSADRNANNVLTLQEIFQYTWTALVAEGQHVRVYPDQCTWFGMLRK